MSEPILLPPSDAPRRKFWRPWKWAGLIFFATALLFGKFLPDSVVTAAYLCGIIVLANLVCAGLRYVKNRFFWRVRNRLLGAFIFVGVIPLVTLLGLVFLSAYVLFGQMAGQFFKKALEDNNHLISEINAELSGQIASSDPAAVFEAKAAAISSARFAEFPRLASRLLRKATNGTMVVVATHDLQRVLPDLAPHPGNKWLEGAAAFEGILHYKGKLFSTSLRPVPATGGFYVETLAPLDRSVEDRMRREKSIYVTFLAQGNVDTDITVDQRGAHVTIQDRKGSAPAEKEAEKRIKRQVEDAETARQSDSRRMITWFLPISGKLYETGKDSVEGVAMLHIPWSIILKTYLGQGDGQGPSFLIVIYILAGLFAFTELVSLVIGFTISRRVTRSVHDMHQGILALQKGDLEHKISVKHNDQLSLLAHSFNQMSGSIARLLDEVVEKKRLEQELEIAREVQATLFPKQLPHPPGMAVFGGCKPARVVSGDYYDFVVEDEKHLNIIVGDISGKGISAALLMANLQAAMRTQLVSSKQNNPESVGKSLAEVMAQLNQQIYLSSPPEKYATLFLSRYDADSRRLWYCNAGHLPPVVFDGRQMQSLEATGTVVGLFPNTAYEAKSIDLPPGSVLAIFTDGVTEAVNREDEEFGENRLFDALRQSLVRTPEGIWNSVVSRISDWQGDLPQHDDITLIVAKTA
jgi:phosphoserine phosphatase RsbU/P